MEPTPHTGCAFDRRLGSTTGDRQLTSEEIETVQVNVGLRCNQSCKYCHASRTDMDRVDTDMSLDVAKQAVDMAITLSMAHRYMHFEGRPLLEAIPKAVDDIDDYEWFEGEVLGGMVVGWNFGDGHLNDTQLLEAVQEQCGFEPGEVRVVMIESQPLFHPTMAWKIVDAASGVLETGVTRLEDFRELQPWPTGSYAEALVRGGAASTP